MPAYQSTAGLRPDSGSQDNPNGRLSSPEDPSKNCSVFNKGKRPSIRKETLWYLQGNGRREDFVILSSQTEGRLFEERASSIQWKMSPYLSSKLLWIHKSVTVLV